MGLRSEAEALFAEVNSANETERPDAEKKLQDFLDKKETEWQTLLTEREANAKNFTETNEANKKLIEEIKKELEETKNNLIEAKKVLETKEVKKLEPTGVLL